MTPRATSITTVAEEFFAACETGKGWDVCNKYCTPNATFTAQAEPLLEVKTLADEHEGDEGDHDRSSGRALRSEVFRHGYHAK